MSLASRGVVVETSRMSARLRSRRHSSTRRTARHGTALVPHGTHWLFAARHSTPARLFAARHGTAHGTGSWPLGTALIGTACHWRPAAWLSRHRACQHGSGQGSFRHRSSRHGISLVLRGTALGHGAAHGTGSSRHGSLRHGMSLASRGVVVPTSRISARLRSRRHSSTRQSSALHHLAQRVPFHSVASRISARHYLLVMVQPVIGISWRVCLTIRTRSRGHRTAYQRHRLSSSSILASSSLVLRHLTSPSSTAFQTDLMQFGAHFAVYASPADRSASLPCSFPLQPCPTSAVQLQ
jgi:hypothetical protein